MSADLEKLARDLIAAHAHLVAAARDAVLKLSAIGAAIEGSSFGPRVLEVREAKTSKLKTDPRVLRDLKRHLVKPGTLAELPKMRGDFRNVVRVTYRDGLPAAAAKKCSVKKCGRAVVARGMCHRHYTAARRAKKTRANVRKPKGSKKIMSTKPKSAPPFARNAAVLEPITRREATPAVPRALGRGPCQECREVWPLFEVGKRALCRSCGLDAGAA